MENMTLSAGYTYTKAGDVKIVHEIAPGVPSGLTLDYKDNNVSGFGIKIGFLFKLIRKTPFKACEIIGLFLLKYLALNHYATNFLLREINYNYFKI